MESTKEVKGNLYKVVLDEETGEFKVFFVIPLSVEVPYKLGGDLGTITAEFPVIAGTVEKFPDISEEQQTEFWEVFENALYKALEDDELDSE